MRFRDLSIGETFEFDHSGLPPCHGMKRGPWVKTNARKYDHATDKRDYNYQVGSINVAVIPKGGKK